MSFIHITSEFDAIFENGNLGNLILAYNRDEPLEKGCYIRSVHFSNTNTFILQYHEDSNTLTLHANEATSEPVVTLSRLINESVNYPIMIETFKRLNIVPFFDIMTGEFYLRTDRQIIKLNVFDSSRECGQYILDSVPYLVIRNLFKGVDPDKAKLDEQRIETLMRYIYLVVACSDLYKMKSFTKLGYDYHTFVSKPKFEQDGFVLNFTHETNVHHTPDSLGTIKSTLYHHYDYETPISEIIDYGKDLLELYRKLGNDAKYSGEIADMLTAENIAGYGPIYNLRLPKYRDLTIK